MVHDKGEQNHMIHELAWNTFKEAADKALALKLYGAGQDLLKNAFSGNVCGMGPGVAEMEITERGADPIVVFAADKTSAGSFNYPLLRMFAEPLNTAGLVIDPNMLGGFKLEVVDTIVNRVITLSVQRKPTSF
jgi:fructose 1,6-bisphosphate aldolase/phosphatase